MKWYSLMKMVRYKRLEISVYNVEIQLYSKK